MIDIYVRELSGIWFGLASSAEKIVATVLGSDREQTLKALLRSLPPQADHQIIEELSGFAERTFLALEKAHKGIEGVKDFTLAIEYFPEPLASVLKVAASIPPGYVSSYGSIAKAANTEPRTVGVIMASNPLYPIVPCHRVVGSDFSLVGYGGRKSPQALKAKLSRLSKECRGFKSVKEVAVEGTMNRVYPTEYVIRKAEKEGLSLSTNHQHTLSNYVAR